MENNFSRFREKLEMINLSMTERMEEQFSLYYDLLMEWNQVMNLTAITGFEEAVDKHFLDSVILGHYIALDKNVSLIDVGTGAGFPGIPLKIMFPEIHVTLADSLNKRVKFLNEVISQLELEHIAAVHGRAEELAGNAAYREQYDYCVSRAVANLAVLSEYCIPFVKKGGTFIAYKSAGIQDELKSARKAVRLLGGSQAKLTEFILPDTEYHRSFVMIDKIEHTSKKFPRKAGMPSKESLC